MPLRAITSVHGEVGLRERLLMEIAAFPAADRERTQDALALAALLHAQDLRQREPYGNHLLRVTIRILRTTGSPTLTWRAPRCCTTLSKTTPPTSPPAVPAGRPGGAGRALRRPHRRAGRRGHQPRMEPGRDEHEQYREHVIASLAATPWARVIKASDFTDNAVGIIHITGPKLARLARKYGPLVPALRELILRPDTPLEANVKDMIAAQLDAAQERFTVIGHGHDGDSGTSQASGAAPAPS